MGKKSWAMTASYDGAVPWNTIERSQRNMVAEPIRIPEYGIEDKARPLGANYSNNCGGFEHRMFSEKPNKQQVDMVATPIRIGLYPNNDGVAEDHRQNRVYSIDGKSVNLCGNGGGMGAKTGLYAVPVEDVIPTVLKKLDSAVDKFGYIPEFYQPYNNAEITDKTPTLTTRNDIQSGVTTVLATLPIPRYAIPVEFDGDIPLKAVSATDGKTYPVYQVKDGFITIKGKSYPIKLADGYYIIRKLTITECKRLQTVPEWYEFPVSDTQAYKMLGNGWTCSVIEHLIRATQADQLDDEQLNLFEMIGV